MLTRDYYANIENINNKYLQQYSRYNEATCKSQATFGYLQPQSFMFFDSEAFIYTSTDNIPKKYSIAIPEIDKKMITNSKINIGGLQITPGIVTRYAEEEGNLKIRQ